MPTLYLPALRGLFGDWVYYSCLMQLDLLAAKVNYAKELHKSTQLSELIQRELTQGRGKEIAKYLRDQHERFFNSLVVAVYGGDPEWLQIGKLTPPKGETFDTDDIPETVRHSIGFLRLSGKEKLFAIDGQHRLAGIKQAVPRSSELGNEEISVLLVAHKNTATGLKRTRRLFTTLNKTAVKVTKGEIIALDEDDVMAICVRRFVEESDLFQGNRLLNNATNNLPVGDTKSLTTFGNLYDILFILFEKCKRDLRREELRFIRPEDAIIDEHYQYASDYFSLLRRHFTVLRSYFDAPDPRRVVRKHRGDFGGNVMLRPVGLLLFAEVIAVLHKHYSFDDAVEYASALPQQLAEPPFADILWDTRSNKIISAGRAFARAVLLYILGDNTNARAIGDTYAQRLGVEQDGLALLRRLRSPNNLPLSQGSLAELQEIEEEHD